MRLILLRHAKAEKGEPGTRDRDRPLSPRGRKDAERLGAYLAHHALVPDLTIVSPALRTCETWKRIAAAFETPPAVNFDERLYNAGAQTALGVLMESGASARTLLIIGHNPGLFEMARLLVAAGEVEPRERLNEGLPTSGLAVIDFASQDWRKLHPQGGRLERFVTPRLLEAATD